MLHGAASAAASATPLTTVPLARPSPQTTLSALAGKMVLPPIVELFHTTLPLGMPTEATAIVPLPFVVTPAVWKLSPLPTVPSPIPLLGPRNEIYGMVE